MSTILHFDHISVDSLEHADLGRQITSLADAKLAEYRAAREQMIEALSRDSFSLTKAAAIMLGSLAAGGCVYTCGNGGSAAEAQHLAAELIGRFRRNRPAFAAIALTADSAALTAIANDYGYAEVFARQLQGLAGPSDVLVAISTSGCSENVVRAAGTARGLSMPVIAMTCPEPSPLGALADVVLGVPAVDIPTLQEAHMSYTHILCDLVETVLTDLDSPA